MLGTHYPPHKERGGGVREKRGERWGEWWWELGENNIVRPGSGEIGNMNNITMFCNKKRTMRKRAITKEEVGWWISSEYPAPSDYYLCCLAVRTNIGWSPVRNTLNVHSFPCCGLSILRTMNETIYLHGNVIRQV